MGSVLQAHSHDISYTQPHRDHWNRIDNSFDSSLVKEPKETVLCAHILILYSEQQISLVKHISCGLQSLPELTVLVVSVRACLRGQHVKTMGEYSIHTIEASVCRGCERKETWWSWLYSCIHWKPVSITIQVSEQKDGIVCTISCFIHGSFKCFYLY